MREHAGLVRALETAQRRLGRRLRELRADRGLSQEQAAERAMLSAKHLRRLEGGEANVTLASLIACARAYGVQLRDLFDAE